MAEKEEVLCAGCCKPIGLKWIVAMEQKWHKYCFCCDDCKMPIDSKKSFFFEKGGNYFKIEGRAVIVDQ